METTTRPTKLDWHQLMSVADDLSVRSGYGLAHTWGLIQQDDYPVALESLRDLLEAYVRGEIGHRLSPRHARQHRASAASLVCGQ